MYSKVEDERMKELILSILNRFEGYKTRLKEFHWTVKTMSMHTLIDKISKSVDEFQDTLAEDYQGEFQDFEIGVLRPKLPGAVDIKSLIREMREDVAQLSDSEDFVYAGIRSISDDFIHKLNVYLYLIRRCVY